VRLNGNRAAGRLQQAGISDELNGVAQSVQAPQHNTFSIPGPSIPQALDVARTVHCNEIALCPCTLKLA
jgi:hypothetical protein